MKASVRIPASGLVSALLLSPLAALSGCDFSGVDWHDKYERERMRHADSIRQRDLKIADLTGKLHAVEAGRGADGKRLVLTPFQPLYSFTAAVLEGSPSLEAANLAPRAQGPHDFVIDDPANAARCRDLARRADAVVTLRSLPLAPQAERIYPWCRRENVRIVEIDPAVTWEPGAPRLPLIPDPPDTARAREKPAGSDTPGDRGQKPPPTRDSAAPNPHVWLAPTQAVRLVGNIARDVAALDPEHAALYRDNADRFARTLRELKAEYDRKLAGAEHLTVGALTEGFPYLTADFGIDVADYVLDPKDPAEVTVRLRAARVKVVIAESPPPADIARAVEAAGARVVVLSTMEEGRGTGDGLDPDGYLKAMRDNLDKLVEALSGP